MISKDKVLHIAICGGLSVALMTLMWLLGSNIAAAIVASIVCSMSAGAGKEFGDSINPYNSWNWWDFTADIIGAVCGTCLGCLLWL